MRLIFLQEPLLVLKSHPERRRMRLFVNLLNAFQSRSWKLDLHYLVEYSESPVLVINSCCRLCMCHGSRRSSMDPARLMEANTGVDQS